MNFISHTHTHTHTYTHTHTHTHTHVLYVLYVLIRRPLRGASNENTHNLCFCGEMR